MRMDGPIAPVTQNCVTSVRISSFVKHCSISPPQSLQLRSF